MNIFLDSPPSYIMYLEQMCKIIVGPLPLNALAAATRTGGRNPCQAGNTRRKAGTAHGQMTQGISGSGARRWSVRKHCHAGQVSDNSARWLTCLGAGGKRTVGQRNARGAVVPPGVSPGDPLVPFPSLGKDRPAAETPFAIPRLGHGKEDPSSVTACAVTPSPQRGKALGKTARRPTGAPALQEGVLYRKLLSLREESG